MAEIEEEKIKKAKEEIKETQEKALEIEKIQDEELKSELNKCKVICSNCHRQVTSKIIVIKNDIQ